MKIKLLLTLSIATLFVAAATASTRLVERAAPLQPNSPSTPSATTGSQVNGQTPDESQSAIQVVLLAVNGEGFEPAEINLPMGEYLFVVRNRSGRDEINVRLVRENGEHLGQAKVVARRHDWKQRLKLTPGTYILSEVSRSDWNCRIVVSQ